MIRMLIIILFIKISFFGYAQQSNQYTFDKTTFNQINSKKHKDGLYLSFNELIHETNSFGNQFQMKKSLDTIIYDDRYVTYTIKYEDNEKVDSILVDIKSKKETKDIEFNKKDKDKQKVFPLICFNDTFYYLIYHNFNKKEYNYAQIPKDKPFQTINILIPTELYNFYQRKGKEEKYYNNMIWNYGASGSLFFSLFTNNKKSKGFSHLKSNNEMRFDQWGSIVDNYILSTFIFSPVYEGIIEASYNRVNDILDQKPHLKAQLDEREMVDVGDGMQMPKYKYTRTTVYQLIEKLNDSILDNENVK